MLSNGVLAYSPCWPQFHFMLHHQCVARTLVFEFHVKMKPKQKRHAETFWFVNRCVLVGVDWHFRVASYQSSGGSQVVSVRNVTGWATAQYKPHGHAKVRGRWLVRWLNQVAFSLSLHVFNVRASRGHLMKEMKEIGDFLKHLQTNMQLKVLHVGINKWNVTRLELATIKL